MFNIKRIFPVLVFALVHHSCSEKSDTKPAPTVPTSVSTSAVSAISFNNAVAGGTVGGDGGATLSAVGVCFSSSNTTPGFSDQVVTMANPSTGTFSVNLQGLASGVKFYVRAFATNSAGTSYGNVVDFTTSTLPVPELSTSDVTSITATGAVAGGNITDDHGATVNQRGICWSTTNNTPTLADNSEPATVGGAGSFSIAIHGLEPVTTYYVRAYATSNNGTGYGSTVQFITLADLPQVTTGTSATNLGNTSATLTGEVVKENGSVVTSRGICYNTSPSPTVGNNKVLSGSGPGSFTANLVGLEYGTKYYARAFATNAIGTTYGSTVVFETTGLKDRDGNVYNTVKIGTQTWMAENLKVTSYNNGGAPAEVETSWSWQSYGTNGLAAYCSPNGNPSNVTEYGRLYNYYAISSGNLCPVGWHVPSKADMDLLNINIGSNAGKLKATSTWQSFSGIINTNQSGFNAKASGWRDIYGQFYEFGQATHLRTNTSSSTTNGAHIMRFLNYDSNSFTENSTYLDPDGATVRCIKD